MINERNEYNVEQEVLKLVAILKDEEKFDKEKFLNQMAFLQTLVKPKSIDYEIKKLLDIQKKYGCGEEFQEQLEFITSFMETKVESYVPINKKIRDFYTKTNKKEGISFLCEALDKKTGGMIAPSLSVIMGGSGCMKTTYAVNICYNAIKEGKNVIYLSLEESPQQLYSKLLSRVSVDVGKPISHQDIIQHKLSEKDENFLFDEVQKNLESLPGTLFIVGESDFINYDTSEIESKLKKVDNLIKEETKRKNNEEEHGADIVVVDHIQLLKYAGEIQFENSTINKYVSFFRRQSLSFLHQKREIIVILLSQVNREGIKYASCDKHYGQYLMQHIGEASEIERAATYVVTVYCNAQEQLSKTLKIGTLKLRNAPLFDDTINVYAEGAYYQAGDVPVREQTNYNMDDINNIDNSQKNLIDEELLSEFGLNEKEKVKYDKE